MKRVTLTKLLNPEKPITAIKCLRLAADGRPYNDHWMGLRDAKTAVDAVRAGREVTVKVDTPTVLSDAFEFRVVPDAEHFHVSDANHGSLLVVDNLASDPGKRLYIEAAYDAVGVTHSGLLDAKESTCAAISREDAERLYEFLGDWLGK